MQIHFSGRHPHPAGAHHARGPPQSRRGRYPAAQLTHAGRAQRGLESAVCGQHGGHAQRAAVVRALRCQGHAADHCRLSRFHRETISRGNRPAAARALRSGGFSRRQCGRRKVPHPARADGGPRAARFRFRRVRPAARNRAQHPVSRIARDRLHRREKPARPGSSRQCRLLPHVAYHRAGGLRGRPDAACCRGLPLDFRHRIGRCDCQRAVAGDARQGARGERPAPSIRAGRNRCGHRNLFRELRDPRRRDGGTRQPRWRGRGARARFRLVQPAGRGARARVPVPRRTLRVVGRLGRRRPIPRRHGCHARLSRARRRHRGEPVFRAPACRGERHAGRRRRRVRRLHPESGYPAGTESAVGGR